MWEGITSAFTPGFSPGERQRDATPTPPSLLRTVATGEMPSDRSQLAPDG